MLASEFNADACSDIVGKFHTRRMPPTDGRSCWGIHREVKRVLIDGCIIILR
jgi:hypothetical protein